MTGVAISVNSLFARYFLCFTCRLVSFFKLTFSINSFRNTIRVSNGLDLDQDSVGLDLSPNCLQRLSAGDKSQSMRSGIWIEASYSFHSLCIGAANALGRLRISPELLLPACAMNISCTPDKDIVISEILTLGQKIVAYPCCFTEDV